MSLAQSSILLIVIYFLVIIILSMMKSVYLPGRAIYLLRALFPSWKFFEDICDLPVLYYRISYQGQEFGEWQACFDKLKRQPISILYNPEGNFQLACNGLLQQLESDIEELDPAKSDEFAMSVSYQLTKQMVLFYIVKKHHCSTGFSFQFKVLSVMQGSAEPPNETFLTSVIHQA